MGLALYNDPSCTLPADDSSLAELQPVLAGAGRASLHTQKHSRAPRMSKSRYFNYASRYEWYARAAASGVLSDLELQRLDPWWDSFRPRKLHPHQLATLNAARRAARFASNDGLGGFGGCGRAGRHRTRRQRAAARGEDEEGRDIAHSVVRLPSGDPPRRPPSLERQGAFCDDTTSNTRSCPSGDDPTDAELYRLGLLYDDAHLRGSGFGFDAITHREPAYSLRIVHSSTKRRPRQNAKESGSFHASLPLDLSFSRLRDDEAIARFLSAEAADCEKGETDPFALTEEEERAMDLDEEEDVSRSHYPPLAPLLVDLDESQSQGSNSTHSLAHNEDIPMDTDFTPRISHDNISYYEDDDDNDIDNDWAVLQDEEEEEEEDGQADTTMDISISHSNTAIDVDTDYDSDNYTTDPASGTNNIWILLR